MFKLITKANKNDNNNKVLNKHRNLNIANNSTLIDGI